MTKQIIVPKEYKEDDEQDWIRYLDQNFVYGKDRTIPFPHSNWNYARHESPFDHCDGLKEADEDVHAQVIQKLYESTEVDASLIKVDVLNGHVFLEGGVFHETEREAAEKLVSQIPGVWKVVNNIKILLPHH